MVQMKPQFATYLLLLTLVGSGLIATSLVVTPEFAITRISVDGSLTPRGLLGLQIFRRVAISIGSLVLIGALLSIKFRSKVTGYLEAKNFPLLTLFLVLICWGALAGTYRTGEMAGAYLFIYPYFFLTLRKMDCPVIHWMTLLTGLQTLVMQTFGEFRW